MSRGRLEAAEDFLFQLHGQTETHGDLAFQIALAEIEICLRRKDCSKAMEALEVIAASTHEQGIDVWHQIKIMTTKARIFDAAGIAPKGFSLAIRAASLAWSSQVYPLLWEAVNEICAVCNSVEEFEAAAQLLESIAPQVLECEDCELAGRTFSILADSYVGIAGKVKSHMKECKEHLSRALEHLNRACEEYAQLGDVEGQCQVVAKRATIMHMLGDPVLANDCAAEYLAIKKATRQEDTEAL